MSEKERKREREREREEERKRRELDGKKWFVHIYLFILCMSMNETGLKITTYEFHAHIIHECVFYVLG